MRRRNDSRHGTRAPGNRKNRSDCALAIAHIGGMNDSTSVRNRSVSAQGEAGDADARLGRYDWDAILAKLDANGSAVIEGLLTPGECRDLIALYDDENFFRSRIVMARHGFGSGEYKYFAYPLPALIGDLRGALYARFAPLANDWNAAMKLPRRYPDAHEAFLEECHAAGQKRPTPLLLKYGPGDYNCLHQDVYGEYLFPIQMAVLLADPAHDFTGGEFVLTEQRPRMQSRVEVVSLRQGDAVAFAVNDRPVRGTKGFYRVTMRHGVSRLRSGERYTLGIIFHDAT